MESNRRRRPFQGRLLIRRSGLKSTDVTEGNLGWRRIVWAVLGSSMCAYCARTHRRRDLGTLKAFTT
jgi:hypothetical protein